MENLGLLWCEHACRLSLTLCGWLNCCCVGNWVGFANASQRGLSIFLPQALVAVAMNERFPRGCYRMKAIVDFNSPFIFCSQLSPVRSPGLIGSLNNSGHIILMMSVMRR